MFDFPMLETAIGLSLVFILFSLLITAVQELLASLLDSRGKFLKEGIENLLYHGGSTELAERVFRHPLVQTLNRGDRDFSPEKPGKLKNAVVNVSRPFRRWDGKRFVEAADEGKAPLRSVVGLSYMPTATFSEVLLDEVSAMVGRDRADPRTLPLLRRGILGHETLGDSTVGKTFVHLIDRAERRVEAGSGEEELLAEIEAWFDSGMDQVSGWYRRHTQKALLLLGLGLAARQGRPPGLGGVAQDVEGGAQPSRKRSRPRGLRPGDELKNPSCSSVVPRCWPSASGGPGTPDVTLR